MKMTLTTLAVLIASFTLLAVTPSAVYGLNIKLVEKIEFAKESKLQTIPISFCVTDDELFLIPDHQDGNIKIFEKDGIYLKLIKKFGRKGFGNDEFERSAYCFYDKYSSKFGVIDIGSRIRKVYIFDRIGKIDFKRIKTVKVEGYDMKLAGDGKHLIISGYKTDKEKNPFDLYSINLEKIEKEKAKEIDVLLPSPKKYGLSEKEYQTEFFVNQTLLAIGIRAFIDIYGDNVYFVWEGKLRIIKINLNTKTQTIFDQPMNMRIPHYSEPVASGELNELRKAYSKIDISKVTKQRAKISFVRNIFATSRYVFIVYEGPNESNFRMQMYTLEGKLLDDTTIPGKPDRTMYFDKQNYTLYSFVRESKSEEPQILIYKVNR